MCTVTTSSRRPTAPTSPSTVPISSSPSRVFERFDVRDRNAARLCDLAATEAQAGAKAGVRVRLCGASGGGSGVRGCLAAEVLSKAPDLRLRCDTRCRRSRSTSPLGGSAPGCLALCLTRIWLGERKRRPLTLGSGRAGSVHGRRRGACERQPHLDLGLQVLLVGEPQTPTEQDAEPEGTERTLASAEERWLQVARDRPGLLQAQDVPRERLCARAKR
jgi:hypothetical protein